MSDAIYREVQRLREAGKPVVVSTGNVAVSGGYYISGAFLSHFNSDHKGLCCCTYEAACMSCCFRVTSSGGVVF